MAINPPSIGVATFDGLDSLGKPYNINDVLAKGYADKMISQPVRVDLIDPSLRTNLSVSFFYQLKGRGELPDAGDLLRLSMLNKSGIWEIVWSVENDNSQQTDIFYPVTVAIPTNDDRFFHEKFRFKFENFARLSGPYDTWNLDYIFIGNGNVSNDPPPFPDRTLVYPLTSVFTDYSSLPIKHFLTNPAATLTKPSFIINNRRSDQTDDQEGGQPVNYVSDAFITTRKNKVITTESINLNNNNVSEGTPVFYNTNKTITLNTLPLLDKFDPDADSISVKIKLNLTTADNVIKVLGPPKEGDYVPAIYSPIDFRTNDSTSSIFTLSNYYAYDDGIAEYGAGIKGFGVQVMYRFDMKTSEPDTLVGVKIYFPRFGDESSQLIQLQVFKDLDGTGASTLHQESVTVQRSEANHFVNYTFSRFVGVQGTFYIGWKQNTTAAISVGLDKNTDSSNKIYFNTGGEWGQDPNTKGSLMIRPVFGKGGLIVGLPENAAVNRAYPNPTKGVLFLSPLAEQVKVIDLTGHEINFHSEYSDEYQRVDLGTTPAGIYIVRYLINKNIRTEKIILQK